MPLKLTVLEPCVAPSGDQIANRQVDDHWLFGNVLGFSSAPLLAILNQQGNQIARKGFRTNTLLGMQRRNRKLSALSLKTNCSALPRATRHNRDVFEFPDGAMRVSSFGSSRLRKHLEISCRILVPNPLEAVACEETQQQNHVQLYLPGQRVRRDHPLGLQQNRKQAAAGTILMDSYCAQASAASLCATVIDQGPEATGLTPEALLNRAKLSVLAVPKSHELHEQEIDLSPASDQGIPERRSRPPGASTTTILPTVWDDTRGSACLPHRTKCLDSLGDRESARDRSGAATD